MRILHILQSPRISGAENVVADICMMFNGEYEMMYCSPDGSIRQALKDRGVSYLPLNEMNSREVRRAIKTYQPDIIHAHDIRATILAALVSGKIPVISHLHGNAEDMRRLSFKSVLYMLASYRLKQIIVVSMSCLDNYIFRDHIKRKTHLLTNILYMPRIKKLIDMDEEDYSFDFAFFGRLAYPKNPQRVAYVATEILKKCPDVTFGVIGNGEMKDDMELIFKLNAVRDRVQFTGRLSYPYKAIETAKCMLLCSRYEGTPIAVLEAMSLGVPIVSTRVDGLIKIVENDINGILSDDDDTLVKAVIRVLSNVEYQNLLSKNAKESMMSHNCVTKYKNCLRDIYKCL